MDRQLDYTVSVWGGWTSSTVSSYTIRTVRARDAIQTAVTRFSRLHPGGRINSAWILRSQEISEDPDLA